jgi:N utilization substance protein A
MENLALIDSFSEFKDDKLIDRVTLMAILEDVFRNALKKNNVQTIIRYHY